jgi:putative ABC transport system permease protein
MNWHESLLLAIRAIRLNAVRASLTMLGVIIGVASVISMVAIGTGSQNKISEQLENMGTNNLTVRPGSATRSGVRAGAGTATRLQIDDANAIGELPGIVAVAPVVSSTIQAKFRGTNWATRIEGVTPSYIRVRYWPLVSGNFFTDAHIKNAANVCVLGQTVARELFGLVNPTGNIILIKRIACRVIGVLAAKGASSWGRDIDDTILAPITMVQRKVIGRQHLHRIMIQTEGREEAKQVVVKLRSLMRQRHRLQEKQDDDFRIHNFADLASASEESARVFTWLLGSIATVSLLVGGIGIMNIMLVSVTERTREIGIRRALGATRKNILLQFMLESIVLTGVGGAFGILLGLWTASAISNLSELPISVTSGSIGIAFIFAVVIGIIFGLHPARKAARLRPIEALRYE